MTWRVSTVLSHNNYLVRVWSFYSHWRCLPFFLRNKILINFVGRKNCFFTKYLLLFYMFNFQEVVLDWKPTRRLDFIHRRVGVGELNRRRLEPSATWLDTTASNDPTASNGQTTSDDLTGLTGLNDPTASNDPTGWNDQTDPCNPAALKGPSASNE